MKTHKKLLYLLLFLSLIAIQPITVSAKTQNNKLRPRYKHLTVYANTEIQTALLFKEPHKPVKRLRFTCDKPGILINNNKQRPLDSMLYFQKPGTYKILYKIQTETGLKVQKTINIKVKKDLNSYITKIPVLRLKKDSRLTYQKLMNNIKFNNTRIGRIFLEGHNINIHKKGEYQAIYSLMSTKGLFTTNNITRKVIVY